MTKSTTERIVHGVRVVTTEEVSERGMIRTNDGLVEAMETPYQHMTLDEALKVMSDENCKLLQENSAMVANFVS
ncbi:MAG: hypothetical protein JWR68_1665 [Polaromonas sp.]|nr:hypothetical protein [Polaromonas sp.]